MRNFLAKALELPSGVVLEALKFALILEQFFSPPNTVVWSQQKKNFNASKNTNMNLIFLLMLSLFASSITSLQHIFFSSRFRKLFFRLSEGFRGSLETREREISYLCQDLFECCTARFIEFCGTFSPSQSGPRQRSDFGALECHKKVFFLEQIAFHATTWNTQRMDKYWNNIKVLFALTRCPNEKLQRRR